MDVGDSLCQPAQAKAIIAGTAVVNGVDTTIYKWGDNLGPIPMNELYLYVSDKTKKPVQMIRDLHPFGKELSGILQLIIQTLKKYLLFLHQYGTLAVIKVICNTPSPSDQCASNQFNTFLNKKFI